MYIFRYIAAMVFLATALWIPTLAQAQVGEPTVEHSRRDGLMYPATSALYWATVSNTTDTPIIVSGIQMIDIQDISELNPNSCPRVWFGDGPYRDDINHVAPDPAHPLPTVTIAEPVILQPGESYESPPFELFLIWAAPNDCQNRTLHVTYEADWEFMAPQQTYGIVAGSVTGSAGEPLAGAAVTISGTTDEGVVTENITTTADGTYASINNFHTDTGLTVSASSDGYISGTSSITVVEGENIVELALEQAPIPTGSVSGTLTDTVTGEPVSNAIIEISGVHADGTQISETIYSNAAGQFTSTLEFQAGTSVSMSISAEGYEPIQLTLESISEGTNPVSPEIDPTQVDVSPVTPTPDPVETETPTPESVETETPAPAPGATETPPTVTEPSVVTPVPSDRGPVAPPVDSGEPSKPIVSGLPSTGTGSTTSIGAIVSGALAMAAAIGVAIRRYDN